MIEQNKHIRKDDLPVDSQGIHANGLSELSKQLRILQSTNNEQAATIDKVERKLRIMTDLKGISLHDMKSALIDACRGEVFNELQTEVNILRSQLEIAKTKTSDPTGFNKKQANQNIAKLEVRDGETKGVEESLKAELSRLHKLLREKNVKNAQLEASCKQYENQEKDWKEKYKNMDEKKNIEHQAIIKKLEHQLRISNNKITNSESHILYQKGQIKAFRVKVPGYEESKGQSIQFKKDIRYRGEMLKKEEKEKKTLHDADLKELKLQSGSERINSLRQQVMDFEQTKERYCKLEDQLIYQNKKIKPYKTKYDDKMITERANTEKESQFYKDRMLEMLDIISKERDRVRELESQVSKTQELEELCKKQKEEIKTIVHEKENISNHMKNLERQKIADVAKMGMSVDDANMKRKVEEAKAESLQKQIEVTIKEAQLRKTQFKSRFAMQDERIRDLLQQLSSLQTAFKIEMGKINEDYKHQAELKVELNETDSKMAQQLHICEEEKHQEVHDANTAARTEVYETNAADTILSLDRLPEEGDNKIVEGYLVSKEKFKWKKRYFILHGSFTSGRFKMSYSNGPQKSTKGVIDGIQTSLSRVFPTKKFPRQPSLYPNTFVLQFNPFDTEAKVLTLASRSAEDLEKWMNALEIVTNGIQASNSSSLANMSQSFEIGSKVVIVDLINHPEYNGLTGIITSPIKNNKHHINIDRLQQEVKLSIENLEPITVSDETSRMTDLVTPTRICYRL